MNRSMTDSFLRSISQKEPIRLSDQERLQAEREHKLLEREEAALRRERAYIGRHLALAEKESAIRIREEALHRRSRSLGNRAAVAARLTAPEKNQPLFDPEKLSYTALEVAQQERAAALARREDALISRLDAVTGRIRTLEAQEGLLVYQEEFLRVREEEVSRMSQMLDELEREQAPAPVAAPGWGRPAAAGPKSEGDARIDEFMGEKVPISTPVQPISHHHPPRQQRIGLKVLLGWESEHNFYTGFTRNISSGGLFIATHNMLEIGRSVELLFHLPNGKPIHVHGEVAWLREHNEENPDIPPGMGVRFLDLSPEDQALIQSYISRRDPDFYDGD